MTNKRIFIFYKMTGCAPCVHESDNFEELNKSASITGDDQLVITTINEGDEEWRDLLKPKSFLLCTA